MKLKKYTDAETNDAPQQFIDNVIKWLRKEVYLQLKPILLQFWKNTEYIKQITQTLSKNYELKT